MPRDIFIHTNIANQFHIRDDNAHAALAFAVGTFGVEYVVIVGHSLCGGVQVAVNAASRPNEPLTRWLIPLTERVRTFDLLGLSESDAPEKVTEANIDMQVDGICKSEPIVTAWALGKKVIVHRWVYDLATGLLISTSTSTEHLREFMHSLYKIATPYTHSTRLTELCTESSYLAFPFDQFI